MLQDRGGLVPITLSGFRTPLNKISQCVRKTLVCCTVWPDQSVLTNSNYHIAAARVVTTLSGEDYS